jgi:transcriptional regulator with XRE-family HTH domain
VWQYDHKVLLKLRLEQGRTRRELCAPDVLDVTQHTLMSWETGRAAPRVDYLAILATAYGVSPDSFFKKT